jgi:hypothetical protein
LANIPSSPVSADTGGRFASPDEAMCILRIKGVSGIR